MSEDKKNDSANLKAGKRRSQAEFGFLRPRTEYEQVASGAVATGTVVNDGPAGNGTMSGLVWQAGNPNDVQRADPRIQLGTLRDITSSDKPKTSTFVYDHNLSKGRVFEPWKQIPQAVLKIAPVAAASDRVAVDQPKQAVSFVSAPKPQPHPVAASPGVRAPAAARTYLQSNMRPYAAQISPDVLAIMAAQQKTLITDAPIAGYSKSVVTLGKYGLTDALIAPTAARLRRRAQQAAATRQPSPLTMPSPPVMAVPSAPRPAPILQPVRAAQPNPVPVRTQPRASRPLPQLVASGPMSKLSVANENAPSSRLRKAALGGALVLAGLTLGSSSLDAQKAPPQPTVGNAPTAITHTAATPGACGPAHVTQAVHRIRHKPRIKTYVAAAVPPRPPVVLAPVTPPPPAGPMVAAVQPDAYAPPPVVQYVPPPPVVQYVPPPPVVQYVPPPPVVYIAPPPVAFVAQPEVVVDNGFIPFGGLGWRGPSERFIGGFREGGYRHQIETPRISGYGNQFAQSRAEPSRGAFEVPQASVHVSMPNPGGGFRGPPPGMPRMGRR